MTAPTRQEKPMSLHDTLTAYCAVNDPWRPDYTERKAEATTTLLAEVEAMADAGERDALRVWAAIVQEQEYAARNAALGDKMHRKVPYYDAIVHGELARITADANPPGPGDEAAWCTTCRARRVVEDTDHHASYYQGSHEVETTAVHLACGHTETGGERVVGPAPGGEAAAEAMAQAATRARIDRTHAYHSYED